MIKFLIISFLIFSCTSHKVLKEKKVQDGACLDLESCIEYAGKISQTKYLYPRKLKSKFKTTKNFTLTPENAEDVLSQILLQSGYVRVKISENTYHVIKVGEIAKANWPLIQSSMSRKIPERVTKSFDYYTLQYKITKKIKKLSGQLKKIAKAQKSKYGKVKEIKKAQIILITDNGQNLGNIYTLLKQAELNFKAK